MRIRGSALHAPRLHARKFSCYSREDARAWAATGAAPAPALWCCLGICGVCCGSRPHAIVAQAGTQPVVVGQATAVRSGPQVVWGQRSTSNDFAGGQWAPGQQGGPVVMGVPVR